MLEQSILETDVSQQDYLEISLSEISAALEDKTSTGSINGFTLLFSTFYILFLFCAKLFLYCRVYSGNLLQLYDLYNGYKIIW